VIAAFVDESGNDGKSSVFAMATVLMSNATSYHLGNDWQAMLEDFAVGEFHANDFYRGRGEFRGWTEDRKDELRSAIIELLRKSQVKHSSALVVNDDYRRSFVETGFNESIRPAVNKWKKPYLIAFQHTVGDLRERADYEPKGCYIVPTFDNCQEFMGQAREDYDKRNADGKLGGMHVLTGRHEYVQMQAADLFAWEYRVYAERYIANRQLDPGRVLEALREHSFGAKLWSLDFLEYLRRRVAATNNGVDPATISMPKSPVLKRE